LVDPDSALWLSAKGVLAGEIARAARAKMVT